MIAIFQKLAMERRLAWFRKTADPVNLAKKIEDNARSIDETKLEVQAVRDDLNATKSALGAGKG